MTPQRLVAVPRDDFSHRRSCTHYTDEITADLNLSEVVFRKLNLGTFTLDQYHQFKAIKPVGAEIATRPSFICNTFGINANVLGNELTYSTGIKIHPWGGSSLGSSY